MTPKIRERILNIGLAIISGASVAYLTFALNTSEGKSVRIQKELQEKAPYEYVNRQDDQLQKNFDDYKSEHKVESEKMLVF